MFRAGSLLLILQASTSHQQVTEFTCLGSDNILGDLAEVPTPEECGYLCQDTAGCVFYTYLLDGDCILYSFCDLVLEGCPGDSSSSCSSGTPTNDSCYTPSSHQNSSWSCSPTPVSLTCNLQCQPSYVPHPRTMSTCVGGHWSTPPDSIHCEEGLILLTGGYDGYSPYTAEIYSDTTTCNNLTLPDLPDYRFYHSLDYVDGQILLCGGEFVVGPPTAYCFTMNENYTWIDHSNLTTDRFNHVSLVSGGRLTLMGGGFLDHSTSSEFLYPAIENVWHESYNLSEPTWTACSVMVGENEALVLGGGAESANHSVLYDLTSGESQRMEDMMRPRRGQHGCSLVRGEGRTGVLVAGGVNYEPVLKEAEFLDLSTGQWEEVGSLSSSRQGLVLVETSGGALAMGGLDSDYNVLTTVEYFDMSSMAWNRVNDMKIPRDYFAVTTVPRNMLPCD